jgi:hypothetical protein
VYARLVDDANHEPDTARAAAALHAAVRALRDDRPAQPRLWAPYTHTGV